jgi:hypothetical protein
MSVSLLYPARNRLAFTRQSWAALMSNTDWSLVSEFHVYDDGSEDGTREYLSTFILPPDLARKSTFHRSAFHSPMGVTLDWIRESKAPLLAKLDNDTIMPPGWLSCALNVMNWNPRLDMLGLECMREPAAFGEIDNGSGRGYLPAKFVSGLGLWRRSVFAKELPADNGYFGLEEFQQQRPHITTGWIMPSLPVFLLDRLPMEPWRSLSEEYVRKDWQRKWSLDLRYKPEQHTMWDWWRPAE